MPLRNLRQFLILFVIAIAVASAIVVDWRLVTRAITYPDQPIMAVEWYRPLATVTGAPGPPLPQATEPPAPAFAEALQTIAAYAAERHSTGLLVMHQGRIVLEQYWQGYNATSPFNAMSMSKTIVGILIGQAIAAGDITSLDDAAAQYLPEWRNDARSAITLRDLIYMQSGLRNEDSTTSPLSDLVQLYIGSQVERTALSIPAVEPPGQVFDYNNVNSQVLAIILERATGMAYSEYLSEQLWRSLGATDAQVWLDRPGGMAKTFCCLFGTLHDWARVGQMLLQQGQVNDTPVVSSEWIATMLTPSPIESTFGKHIWVKARTPDHPNVDQAANAPYLADDTFTLDGRDLQRVYVIPSYDVVVVRMGEHPPDWDDAVIPNTLVRALSTPSDRDP